MSELDIDVQERIEPEWRMANVRLACALANEHLLRAQALQCALTEALDSRMASPIERAQRDAESVVKALEEIRDSLTTAMIMGLN